MPILTLRRAQLVLDLILFRPTHFLTAELLTGVWLHDASAPFNKKFTNSESISQAFSVTCRIAPSASGEDMNVECESCKRTSYFAYIII